MPTYLDVSKLSLMDALDLATLIEIEARQRYTFFAEQFGHSGTYDAGAFFSWMAENEAKHGEELAARRKELFGDTPSNVKIEDVEDIEAPDLSEPTRGMSAFEAFEIGIAAERRAHDFYDRALPNITNPEVIELFKDLRDEETEHVEMLKEAMAKLPEEAKEVIEMDLDESPYL